MIIWYIDYFIIFPLMLGAMVFIAMWLWIPLHWVYSKISRFL